MNPTLELFDQMRELQHERKIFFTELRRSDIDKQYREDVKFEVTKILEKIDELWDKIHKATNITRDKR